MFKLSAGVGVICLGFMVWCLVEAISTDRRRIRGLSKPIWILLILLLPLIGAAAWLLYGRPSASAADADALPGPDRRTRRDASNPAEEAADYTTKLRERAEEQRRRYEEQRREKEKGTDKPEADA